MRCFSYEDVSARLPGLASLWLDQTLRGARHQLCVRQREVSSSKWHSLLCQQQPVQLNAAWQAFPGWSIFLLCLSKEFDYSGGGWGGSQSACWRPRSVVEHEESQHFHLPLSLEYYLSALLNPGG